MTTAARVRKGAALALPEVDEASEPAGSTSFVVRGKRFAALSEDATVLEVRLGPDQVDGVVATVDGASAVSRSGRPTGVDLVVADLDVRDLDRLLRQAWEAAAPERLVAEHSSEAAAARTAGLPAIGRPATRALALADITTLERVAEHSQAELRALHGVGPKAIRILGEAMAARDLAFRES